MKLTTRTPRRPRALHTALIAATAVTLGLLANASTALATAPAVLAEGSSSVTPFAARIEAFVNPNEQTTSCKFEYGTTSAYSNHLPCEPATLEGGEQGVGANLTSLQPGTTYHFRVVLENTSAEKTEGTDTELTTLTAEAPIVTSESVAALNSSEPKLEARIIPNYQATAYKFEYSTSEATLLAEKGTLIKGTATLPAVFEELPVEPAGLNGLQPGPTYYYRVIATNATGPTDGPIQTFQALAAPLASTGPASTPTRTTAIVSGTATPQGLPSTYQFLYIPQAAYEKAIAEDAPDPYANARVTPTASVLNEAHEPATDYASHPVQALLEELQPETTYRYTLVATNELGSTHTSNGTFTTAPLTPPHASTTSAQNISQLSATITGNLNTSELPTTAEFELGTTPDAGTLIPATITSTTPTTETLTTTLNNILTPATTYYYRLIATSQDGTSYGAEQSFTTSSYPTPFTTPPATIPPLPHATINELNAKETKENHEHTKPTQPRTHKKHAKTPKTCHKNKPKTKHTHCQHQTQHKHTTTKKKHK